MTYLKTTIALVVLTGGLAACGSSERRPVRFPVDPSVAEVTPILLDPETGEASLVPIQALGEEARPVNRGASTYLVGPISAGRRALAVSADGTATSDEAREVVASVYSGLCDGLVPEFDLYNEIFYPDGRRGWSFLAVCPIG